MSSDSKPSIQPSPNGPYIVKGLTKLANRKGPVETSKTIALCRCGRSANKPFCDGTHAKIGFSSAKLDGRVPDKPDSYEGPGITVHDNRGICAHAGRCTDGRPAVFRLKQEPWIVPDGATSERSSPPSAPVHRVLSVVRWAGSNIAIGTGNLRSLYLRTARMS